MNVYMFKKLHISDSYHLYCFSFFKDKQWFCIFLFFVFLYIRRTMLWGAKGLDPAVKAIWDWVLVSLPTSGGTACNICYLSKLQFLHLKNECNNCFIGCIKIRGGTDVKHSITVGTTIVVVVIINIIIIFLNVFHYYIALLDYYLVTCFWLSSMKVNLKLRVSFYIIFRLSRFKSTLLIF